MRPKTIKDIDVKGRRILMRVDFNVPLDEEGKVRDLTRIELVLGSIEYILRGGGRLILMSHLGRPKGEVVEVLRMRGVGEELSRLLGVSVLVLEDCIGCGVKEAVFGMRDGEVILLENLRFHRAEEENGEDFSRALAELGEIYVNDAFGTLHRNHASVVGVLRFLRGVSGFLMDEELRNLSRMKEVKEHPFVAMIGGSKISTKLSILEALLEKVDILVVGGGLAYNFIKGMGGEIGGSIYEPDYLEKAKMILKKADREGVNLVVPGDHVVSDEFGGNGRVEVVERIGEGFFGMDIGPVTVSRIEGVLSLAKVVLWNGPFGAFEWGSFGEGTWKVFRSLRKSGAFSVIGGGDLIASLFFSAGEDLSGDLFEGIGHVSSGGGACLAYIAGEDLPGLRGLEMG